MATPLLSPLVAALLVLGAGPNPGSGTTDVQAAKGDGRLRLSASVNGARLRVALVDEAERVGQVLAFVESEGRRHLLARLDTTAADRIEFAIDPGLGPSPTIRVEAYGRGLEASKMLHAIELAAPPPLPTAPTPATAGPPPLTDASPTSLPWWFFAGAVIATTLAGIAVYQEIDSR